MSTTSIDSEDAVKVNETPQAVSDVSSFEGDNAYEYRAIHTGAILGLLIALVSLVYPFTVSSFADVRQALILSVAPLAGLVVSLWALSQVRANRDLYTGGPAALAGAVLAAGSFILGTGYGAFVYATEVPDGYVRTSFLEMKPDEVELAADEFITPEVQEKLGKKVFIKGYIRPDSTNNGLRRGIKQFKLVRDNNECCFGDQSKVMYFDQVMVDLGPGLSTDLELRVFNIGGELSVRPGIIANGEPPLVYSIKADHLK